MTRRRWIADEVTGDRAVLLGENAEHLSRVLRGRVGQEYESAANGRIFLGRIAEISERHVTFELVNEIDVAPSAKGNDVDLYVAIFKFERMEWAIEKATELGVSRIVPLIARRSDAHLVSAAAKRAERWRRIAHQASQQSRRKSPPSVLEPVKVKQCLGLPGAAAKIVLSEQKRDKHLAKILRAIDQTQPVVLAVGPEGGWTEDELSAFFSAGWVPGSLGENILRAETAAITALALVSAWRFS